MAWKPIKGSIKFSSKSRAVNFKIVLSSPCPSIIKMSSLRSYKNASNKAIMSISSEGEKLQHLHYELSLNALHGVLFWCTLLRETFLTQLCLKFWQNNFVTV